MRCVVMAVLVIGCMNWTVSAEDGFAGHGHARKATMERANKSSALVKERFERVVKAVSEKGISGDKEHDESIVSSLHESQKQWLFFRDSHCHTNAMLYVYPAGSLMFTQEYHYCIDAMNQARIGVLDDMLKGLH